MSWKCAQVILVAAVRSCTTMRQDAKMRQRHNETRYHNETKHYKARHHNEIRRHTDTRRHNETRRYIQTILIKIKLPFITLNTSNTLTVLGDKLFCIRNRYKETN